MKEYNKEEYKEKMVQVYGVSVVKDFEKFEYRQNSSFPETYEDFKERMERYVSRIGNINEGIKEIKQGKSTKKVSNYYSNKGFARFILISIEKYYGKTKVNLAKERIINEENVEEGKDKKVIYVWETEHIIPQKEECNYDSDYIRCLGNLTLISRTLNGNEKYKFEPFKKKCKIIRESKWRENKFFVNKVFKKQWKFNEDVIDERYKRLKDRFINIFYEDKSRKTFKSKKNLKSEVVFSLDKFEKILGL